MNPSSDLAYILGVVKGDGWIKRGDMVGLNAKDQDFVESFAASLSRLFDKPVRVRLNNFAYGPQYVCSTTGHQFVPWYKALGVEDLPSAIGAVYSGHFLKGLYDSEGSTFTRRRGPSSFQPMYRLYNCDLSLLRLCQRLLETQMITSSIANAGKKGDKTIGDTVRKQDIYVLQWVGHTNSRIWEQWAGSNIARKRYSGPGPSTYHNASNNNSRCQVQLTPSKETKEIPTHEIQHHATGLSETA